MRQQSLNPDQDFIELGKTLKSTADELQETREEKASLHERVAEARRALTVSREKLRVRQSVHQVLNDRRVESEKKAAKKRNQNLIRSHNIESTSHEVTALREELEILEVEVDEAQQRLEHETAQRDLLVELIQKAQKEYLAQQHDRDFYRKQALDLNRQAQNRKVHLQNFTKANEALLEALVLA